MSFIIHRKPPYRVYAEEGQGGAMAHVAELPGCFSTGSTASRAVAAMPKAITSFLAWLRAHREPLVPEAHVTRPTVADLFIAEVHSEGTPILFSFDKIPWDDEKLERTLRWLAYSRADLLAKLSNLTEAEMESHQLAPNRTLQQTLQHIVNAEYNYINCASGPLDDTKPITDTHPANTIERITVTRDILQRHARAIPQERRADVIYPTWTNRPNEPWTLQKALRRALEHELQHLAEL
ncbi:MAG TPA: type II toxin-antitoxin system HicB family antitoxin [Chloroflexia bacterium]|jgi:predicted RNase H-like HicB family nuclease/uncharacterized damage-inducible protein DinB